MFQGDGNSYAANNGNNSGNSYTYITNNISVADSFNTTHSRNGHGRGGWCGVVGMAVFFVVAVLLFGVAVADSGCQTSFINQVMERCP